jgi:DNA-binding HxlR family transcriptional regulator
MSCMEKYIKSANFADTGFSYTMSLISGKHKMVILYCLMEYEPVRFNEMKRYLGTITDKTLSSNLKELEADRLIVRKEYPHSAEGGVFAVGARKVVDEGP